MKNASSYRITFVVGTELNQKQEVLFKYYLKQLFKIMKTLDLLLFFTKKSMDVVRYIYEWLYNLFYIYYSKNRLYKDVSKKINVHATNICFVETGDIFWAWKNYTRKIGNNHIYGIKVDIKDAYGMIDIGKRKKSMRIIVCIIFYIFRSIMWFYQ